MKSNNFKIRLKNVERSLHKFKALRELCNEDEAKMLDIRIKNIQQKKKSLILEMRNELFSSKSVKLNDFLTFSKPEAVIFDGDYYYNSKDEYFWQFVLSRIQIFYLYGRATLNIESGVEKDFLDSRQGVIFSKILKDKFGIEIFKSSAIVRMGVRSASFYNVFNFVSP